MSSPSTATVPLCIDLDGTLIRSDLLVEGFLRLVARNPLMGVVALFWLLRGRANLKAQIASRAALDPATLPYNLEFIEWLREQRAAGRKLILCTAAHHTVAVSIATHLGLFDEVIASDGRVNLAGRHKAGHLEARFGKAGFDYAGNEPTDLHVWRVARRAIVVSHDDALSRRLHSADQMERAFVPTPRRRASSWLRALRLHQWAKNTLIFVPAAVSHRLIEGPVVVEALLAFLCFGLCASGNYIINDLLDLDADRAHARKRTRPFASGELPLVSGIVVAGLLLVIGLGTALLLLNLLFFGALLLYLVGTFWYSWVLKRIAMVDVLALAGLYTLRVLAGSAAINVVPSFWLLAFSMFIFFSLAVVKRYTELRAALDAGRSSAQGRGYSTEDLPLLLAAGVASGFISVMVMALYVNTGSELYRNPHALWLVCPLMLYWICRVWRKAHRAELHDDPVVFAIRDRPSLLVVGLCAVLAFIAT